MVSIGMVVIISFFLIYFFLVLYFEKILMQDPKIIIEKFLAILLFYVGISVTYFSLTGKPFLDDSPATYSIYVFVIGFIVLIWSLVNLLSEFTFFKKFESLSKRRKRK